MPILSDCLIIQIYNDYIFDLESIRNGVQVSKKFNKQLEPLFKKYRKAIQIKYEFPEFIINIFGKINKFLSYNRVLFKKENMGGTGYLDQFTSKEIYDSIMYGIDSYSRPFITLKLEYKYNLDKLSAKEREYYDDNESYSGIVTLFQRYTDSPTSWTCGACYRGMIDLFQTGILRNDTFNAIKELIANRYVEYNYKKIRLI